jgi:hypothetical protein
MNFPPKHYTVFYPNRFEDANENLRNPLGALLGIMYAQQPDWVGDGGGDDGWVASILAAT